MQRFAIPLVLLALAGPVRATDPAPAASPSTRPPAKPKPPPEKVSPQTQRLRDLDIAKAGFMAALGACPRPEACDPDSPDRNPELVRMVKGREEAFMEACAQCASDEACEQERLRIRAGRGRFGSNLCDPTANKPASGKPAEKKAPATKPAPEPKASK
jgi:hypothetical protein